MEQTHRALHDVETYNCNTGTQNANIRTINILDLPRDKSTSNSAKAMRRHSTICVSWSKNPNNILNNHPIGSNIKEVSPLMVIPPMSRIMWSSAISRKSQIVSSMLMLKHQQCSIRYGQQPAFKYSRRELVRVSLHGDSLLDQQFQEAIREHDDDHNHIISAEDDHSHQLPHDSMHVPAKHSTSKFAKQKRKGIPGRHHNMNGNIHFDLSSRSCVEKLRNVRNVLEQYGCSEGLARFCVIVSRAIPQVFHQNGVIAAHVFVYSRASDELLSFAIPSRPSKERKGSSAKICTINESSTSPLSGKHATTSSTTSQPSPPLNLDSLRPSGWHPQARSMSIFAGPRYVSTKNSVNGRRNAPNVSTSASCLPVMPPFFVSFANNQHQIGPGILPNGGKDSVTWHSGFMYRFSRRKTSIGRIFQTLLSLKDTSSAVRGVIQSHWGPCSPRLAQLIERSSRLFEEGYPAGNETLPINVESNNNHERGFAAQGDILLYRLLAEGMPDILPADKLFMSGDALDRVASRCTPRASSTSAAEQQDDKSSSSMVGLIRGDSSGVVESDTASGGETSSSSSMNKNLFVKFACPLIDGETSADNLVTKSGSGMHNLSSDGKRSSSFLGPMASLMTLKTVVLDGNISSRVSPTYNSSSSSMEHNFPGTGGGVPSCSGGGGLSPTEGGDLASEYALLRSPTDPGEILGMLWLIGRPPSPTTTAPEDDESNINTNTATTTTTDSSEDGNGPLSSVTSSVMGEICSTLARDLEGMMKSAMVIEGFRRAFLVRESVLRLTRDVCKDHAKDPGRLLMRFNLFLKKTFRCELVTAFGVDEVARKFVRIWENCPNSVSSMFPRSVPISNVILQTALSNPLPLLHDVTIGAAILVFFAWVELFDVGAPIKPPHKHNASRHKATPLLRPLSKSHQLSPSMMDGPILPSVEGDLFTLPKGNLIGRKQRIRRLNKQTSSVDSNEFQRSLSYKHFVHPSLAGCRLHSHDDARLALYSVLNPVPALYKSTSRKVAGLSTPTQFSFSDEEPSTMLLTDLTRGINTDASTPRTGTTRSRADIEEETSTRGEGSNPEITYRKPRVLLPIKDNDGRCLMVLILENSSKSNRLSRRCSENDECDESFEDWLSVNEESRSKFSGMSRSDWEFVHPFSQENLLMLSDITKILSYEMAPFLQRFLIKQLMTISREDTNACSHNIIEFVLGPCTDERQTTTAVSGTETQYPPKIPLPSPAAIVRSLTEGNEQLPTLSRQDEKVAVMDVSCSRQYEGSPLTEGGWTDQQEELMSTTISSLTLPQALRRSPSQPLFEKEAEPLLVKQGTESLESNAKLSSACLPRKFPRRRRAGFSRFRQRMRTRRCTSAPRHSTYVDSCVHLDALSEGDKHRFVQQWSSLEVHWWTIRHDRMMNFLSTATSFIPTDTFICPSRLSEFNARTGAFFDFIAKKYKHTNPYHNVYHAAQTFHVMWLLLTKHKALKFLSPLEAHALLTATFCHDVDHPGVSNAFLIRTDDPLAIRYNDRSILEHYHAALSFQAMREHPALNLLDSIENLSDKSLFRKTMILAILATDMQEHSSVVANFSESFPPNCGGGDIDSMHKAPTYNSIIEDSTARERLIQLLMHATDLSNPLVPYPYFRYWASLCIQEFNSQVDKEMALNIEVTGFMNCRTEKSRIEMQIGFVEFVVIPTWKPLGNVLEDMTSWYEAGQSNCGFWRACLRKLTNPESMSGGHVTNDQTTQGLTSTDMNHQKRRHNRGGRKLRNNTVRYRCQLRSCYRGSPRLGGTVGWCPDLLGSSRSNGSWSSGATMNGIGTNNNSGVIEVIGLPPSKRDEDRIGLLVGYIAASVGDTSGGCSTTLKNMRVYVQGTEGDSQFSNEELLRKRKRERQLPSTSHQWWKVRKRCTKSMSTLSWPSHRSSLVVKVVVDTVAPAGGPPGDESQKDDGVVTSSSSASESECSDSDKKSTSVIGSTTFSEETGPGREEESSLSFSCDNHSPAIRLMDDMDIVSPPARLMSDSVDEDCFSDFFTVSDDESDDRSDLLVMPPSPIWNGGGHHPSNVRPPFEVHEDKKLRGSVGRADSFLHHFNAGDPEYSTNFEFCLSSFNTNI